ncbi:MAG: hypothetical protein WCT77_04890 [Bacteroidota bacterium]
MEKLFLYILSAFFLTLNFNSCRAENDFEKGKLIERVQCIEDTSQSYALYLPKTYSKDKKYPVIFFFDPSAIGKKPLKLYKDYADKFDFILAGSNNSRNGVPLDIVESGIKIMIADVKERFSIDTNRVYAAGFSGGARVALAFVMEHGGVQGVIALGAGMPASGTINHKFSLLMMVGNEDFNYMELNSLNRQLKDMPIEHHLIVFNGKHKWAPPDVFENAFYWLLFKDMKDGKIAKDTNLAKEFIGKNRKEINLEKDKKVNFGDYLRYYLKNIEFLKGVIDISQDYDFYLELCRTKDFSQINDELIQSESLETEIKERMIRYLDKRDMRFWGMTIDTLYKKFETGQKPDPRLFKRVISFLSLASYLSCERAFANRDDSLINKFIDIYRLVDPDNPDYDFLLAKRYAYKNDKEHALLSLENAVKKGLDDPAKITNDAILSVLKDESKYKKILSQIK